MSCTIGHNVTIGDCSTLSAGVHIAGFVTIGRRVFLGLGTSIINGTQEEPMTIGDDSVVGAGSVVIRSLPRNSRVFGNPARPIPTPTTDEAIEEIPLSQTTSQTCPREPSPRIQSP